jgi:hypothetical protein
LTLFVYDCSYNDKSDTSLRIIASLDSSITGKDQGRQIKKEIKEDWTLTIIMMTVMQPDLSFDT